MKKNNELYNKKIEELLTPKHTPECQTTFKIKNSKRPINLWSHIRTTSIAAMLTLVAIITVKGLMGEEAKAAPSMQEQLCNAIQNFQKQQSVRITLKQRESTTGANGRIEFKENNPFRECTLYILNSDEGLITRSETPTEAGKFVTVQIGDSSPVAWLDGKEITDNLHQAAPVDKEFLNSIFDIKNIINIDFKKEIKPEDIESMFVMQEKGQTIINIKKDEESQIKCRVILQPNSDNKNILIPEGLNKQTLAGFQIMQNDLLILDITDITNNYPMTKEQIKRVPR